jgi:hypothetical protein
MNSGINFELPKEIHTSLWRHLLRPKFAAEEAAFVYARYEEMDAIKVFRYIEWIPVPPESFASRSKFHLELTDDMRAGAIKRAHDLGVSLVEFHSHAGSWPAKFSSSDLFGFREFVPHVWWRLKGRPYLAVVVSRSGFDALAWLKDSKTAVRLQGITVDGKVLTPTGLTPLVWQDDYE